MSILLNIFNKLESAANRIITKAEANFIAKQQHRVTIISNSEEKLYFFTNNKHYGSSILPDTFTVTVYTIDSVVKPSAYKTLDDVVKTKYPKFKHLKNVQALVNQLERMQNV